MLTSREVRYLNSKLPVSDAESIDNCEIPLAYIKRYAELYRYFPSYAEFSVV
jgi:hypothetical protein